MNNNSDMPTDAELDLIDELFDIDIQTDSVDEWVELMMQDIND